MLSALLIQEGKEARAFDMVYLRQKKGREDIAAQTWQCKFCGKPMQPRMGAIRSWYFAHAREASECPFEAESEKESPQHVALKRAAGEALRQHFGTQVQSLEYEVRFPHIKRIADAVLILKDGTRVAVEAQLSPLTLQQLQGRTDSYLRDEIEPVWVFLEGEVGGLKEGGLWDKCRDWLLSEGLLVLTARATITQTAVPLPQLPV
ncbi:competence protein CoiA [Deinococcus petrolearius]|uniref:Competence protein CoiA n=1 Tax=Deinococcus petrolearius TaxID=1751295 RepID=A0ABW1DLU2_9DEIO